HIHSAPAEDSDGDGFGQHGVDPFLPLSRQDFDLNRDRWFHDGLRHARGERDVPGENEQWKEKNTYRPSLPPSLHDEPPRVAMTGAASTLLQGSIDIVLFGDGHVEKWGEARTTTAPPLQACSLRRLLALVLKAHDSARRRFGARRDPGAERPSGGDDADQEARVVARRRDARDLARELRVALGAERDRRR